MNAADFVALLPLITIAATAIVVMIAIAIRRNHKASIVISLLGVSAALAGLPLSASAVAFEYKLPRIYDAETWWLDLSGITGAPCSNIL